MAQLGLNSQAPRGMEARTTAPIRHRASDEVLELVAAATRRTAEERAELAGEFIATMNALHARGLRPMTEDEVQQIIDEVRSEALACDARSRRQ